MIEPLRASNEIAGQDAFGWIIVSENGRRVEASAQVGFDPDLALKDCDKLDQLHLLSGPSSRVVHASVSDAKLRKLAAHGMTMGAVSGGVFPLARAG